MTKDNNNTHFTVAEQLVKKALEQQDKQKQLDDELLKAVHKIGITDPLVLLQHSEQLKKWSDEQFESNVKAVKARMEQSKRNRQQNIEKINNKNVDGFGTVNHDNTD